MTQNEKLDMPIVCPECGAKNDGVTSVGNDKPAPQSGDIGMCSYCTTFLVYEGSNGRHATHAHVMTPEEIVDLPGEARRMLVTMRSFLKEHPRSKPDDDAP